MQETIEISEEAQHAVRTKVMGRIPYKAIDDRSEQVMRWILDVERSTKVIE